MAHVERLVDVQVRSGQQHAPALDQSGDPDAEPGTGAVGTQFDGHRGDGVEDGRAALRCRPPGLTQDRPGLVDDDTEHLRPAHVDTDVGHGHAPAVTPTSARVFSSRKVLRMRTSARRLTKPGRGTTSSMVRS